MALLIVESHPVQYHAPVYRSLVKDFGVPVHVCYGTMHGTDGSFDPEFGVHRSWDVDLLAGYVWECLGTQKRSFSGSLIERADEFRQSGNGAILSLGYSNGLDRLAASIGRLRGLPIIFRGEATDHAIHRSWTKRILRDCLLRAFYGSVSAFAAIGSRARKHYLRLGVCENRVTWSPYCIDGGVFDLEPCSVAGREQRSSVRAALGLKDDAFVVLFSGKLSERKGPDLILSALSLMRQEVRRRFAVLFVGDGSLRAELEHHAKELAPLGVAFAGFRNQTELSPFFHASDALCLPSRSGETWGLVVNEALMHGLPVVVTKDVGCADDLVLPGRTGVVLEAASADAIATGLQEVESIAMRPNCGADCRSAVARYSVENAARGLYQAYLIALSA